MNQTRSKKPVQNQQQQDYHKPESISEAYNNPRYQGKIVIESPEGLYSTTKDENAISMLKKLQRKYSETEVVTTVIPRAAILP